MLTHSISIYFTYSLLIQYLCSFNAYLCNIYVLFKAYRSNCWFSICASNLLIQVLYSFNAYWCSAFWFNICVSSNAYRFMPADSASVHSTPTDWMSHDLLHIDTTPKTLYSTQSIHRVLIWIRTYSTPKPSYTTQASISSVLHVLFLEVWSQTPLFALLLAGRNRKCVCVCVCVCWKQRKLER